MNHAHSDQSIHPLRRKTHSRRRGFTLVEMIVSLMIFAVVAVVALGAVIKIISTNKKAQTLQSAITNVSFALDAMSRDVRVGSSYYCANNAGTSPGTLVSSGGNTCSSGFSGSSGAIFVFQSPKTDPSSPTCHLDYSYRFNPQSGGTFTLEKAQQTSCGVWGTFTPIVSSDVTISSYYLMVSNSTYPLVYVEISGYAGTRVTERTYFDINTALSPRTPS